MSGPARSRSLDFGEISGPDGMEACPVTIDIRDW